MRFVLQGDTILDATQTGSTDGTDFTGYIGGGYDFKSGNWSFGPTIATEFNYSGINAFTESGGFAPLAIDSQDNTSLVSRLGGRASYLWKAEKFWLYPNAYMAWQHEYLDTSSTINSRFANGSGSFFSVQTPKTSADSAIIGVGVDLSITEVYGVYLSNEVELNSDYSADTINGDMRLNF